MRSKVRDFANTFYKALVETLLATSALGLPANSHALAYFQETYTE